MKKFGLLLLLWALFIGFFSPSIIDNYNQHRILHLRGAHAVGTVLGYHKGTCGPKAGCNLYADYSFSVRQRGYMRLYTSSSFITGTHPSNSAIYIQSLSTHTVPVIFDSKDPTFSRIDNSSYAQSPIYAALFEIGVLSSLFAVIAAIAGGHLVLPAQHAAIAFTS